MAWNAGLLSSVWDTKAAQMFAAKVSPKYNMHVIFCKDMQGIRD